jgi:hypothetical protein
MRVYASLCPQAPDFPDFHREIVFVRSGPDIAPARKTVLNMLCARELEYFG